LVLIAKIFEDKAEVCSKNDMQNKENITTTCSFGWCNL